MPKLNPKEVKALSIAQPWAELILRHRKPIEIRTWKRNFVGGTLILHASQKWRANVGKELGVSKDEVTFGAFVGVATVKEIRPFSRTDHNQLMDKGGDTRGYRPNQHAWVLEGIHRLDKPIRFRGMLGLFNPPKRAIDAAQRAIAKANRIAAKAVRNRKVLAANAGH